MFAKNISKRKHYFLYSVMFRKCQDIYSQNIIYVLTSSKRKELNREMKKEREREKWLKCCISQRFNVQCSHHTGTI